MDLVFFVGVVASGIRFSTPLLFAALGETVAQRSGVLNVGLEGIMLVGAFLGLAGAVATGSPWGGLGLALLGGLAMGAVHAFFAVTLKVDQIVCGIALIILGLGLSSFGYRLTLGGTQTAIALVPSFKRLDFWGLSQLPVVGPILFSHHLLAYLAIALAFVLAWFLFRTRWGLDLRAAGENPAAVDAAGLSVARIRYAATLFGGAMAGIGGASLSIAQLSGFVENMVAGRGFIAIACVLFGGWHPLGVLLATLFFGLADAAQIRFQTASPDIPYQFFVMAPYAAAIVALVLWSRRSRMPAALTKPFTSGR